MKKTFLLAGFTTIVLACNNNSNNNVANTDSSSHAAHNETSSDTKNENKMNPVTETMDKMMHEMHGA
jgi:hypothetical protein